VEGAERGVLVTGKTWVPKEKEKLKTKEGLKTNTSCGKKLVFVCPTKKKRRAERGKTPPSSLDSKVSKKSKPRVERGTRHDFGIQKRGG